MKLDKLLWSKAKADIIKYLVFKRQGVSIRALETDLEWSFPAIQKQIASLEESDIIMVNKEEMKFSIQINPDVAEPLKNLFVAAMKADLMKLTVLHTLIAKCYLGEIFGYHIDADVVMITHPALLWSLETLQKEMSELFHDYLMDRINVVFMSLDDFSKRSRMADKFVLNLLRTNQ